MKTVSRLFVLASLCTASVFGQASGPIIQFVNADPSGTCANPTPFQYNQLTGNMSGCNSTTSQWASIAGGSGPQGPQGALGTTTRSATTTHTLSETDRFNNWTFTGTSAPTLTLYTPADNGTLLASTYWTKVCNGTTADGTVNAAGTPYGTGTTGGTSTASFTFPRSTTGLITCMIFSWTGSTWSIDPTNGPGVSSVSVAVTGTKTLAQGDAAILQQISGSTFTINAPATPTGLTSDWAVPMVPTGTVDYTLSGNGNTISGLSSVTLKACPSPATNGCYGYVLQLDAAGTNYTLRGGVAGGGGSGCTPSGSATQVLTDSGAGACTSNAAFVYASGTATLGTAGSVVGALAMKNATSGTATIHPVTGALGTVDLAIPASSGTIPITVCASGTASSTTSSLTEANLAVCNVPAAAMGANSNLGISALYKFTGTSNTKTPTIRFSTTTGDTSGGFLPYNNATINTTLSQKLDGSFSNSNSTSAQVANAGAFGNSTITTVTGSVSTASATFVNFNCLVANAGDSCQIVWYRVVLYHE